MNAEWLPIAEFPDYEISRNGDVRRVTPPRTARWVRGPLKQATYNGYKYVGLYAPGAKRQRLLRVNLLVLRTFGPKQPTPAHQAAHDDGNRVRNHIDNLIWKTPKENCADRLLHGTHLRGEDFGRSDLREIDVILIRQQLRMNLKTMNQLASIFNVSRVTISRIKRRKIWAHL